jgi:hypothetical protein
MPLGDAIIVVKECRLASEWSEDRTRCLICRTVSSGFCSLRDG